MGERVEDAKEAVQVAKEYAETSMRLAYWKDVIDCHIDEKTGYWRVVFLASPSLLDPYYQYEVLVDPNNGAVRSSKRIER